MVQEHISNKGKLTDKEIEARTKDYWKCPKCSELNYIEKIVCWKCDASRPQNYEHPGLEDLRMDLAKENKFGLLWIGLISLSCSGVALGRGYMRFLNRDHVNLYPTYVFAACFAGFGVILIIYWLIRKITRKY